VNINETHHFIGTEESFDDLDEEIKMIVAKGQVEDLS
jgi:hypothetical protein